MKNSYVLFNLENQGYAIDIDLVIEVTELCETTKIPGYGDFMEGVLNLRGDVISIIDLKKRLGLKDLYNKNKQILIVNKDGDQVGLIVDNARDIRSYDEEMLVKTSAFNMIDKDLIEKIINTEDEIIIALDIDQILNKTIEKSDDVGKINI